MNNLIDTLGFHLFDKWMYNLRLGKKIDKFFTDNMCKKIAIYGMGVIGRQIFSELKGTEVEVICGIDRNEDKIIVDGLQVINPDYITRIMEVEAIVVTPIQYYIEIEKMICEKGFKGDIFSIDQVVEYVHGH